jgi:hypothetical protein
MIESTFSLQQTAIRKKNREIAFMVVPNLGVNGGDRGGKMTKITNSNQSRKSCRKHKSENGCTRTSKNIRGGIRCHGEKNRPSNIDN